MHNLNSSVTKKWFTKLACFVGIAGVSTLISFPVLARFYPRYALFQPSAYNNYPYRNAESTNIADTLAQDNRFANLYHELKEAGLLDKLKNGNFTVFAPTNDAFNALPKEVFSRYTNNRTKVLTYHVVPRILSKKDVDSGAIITVEGSPIKITINPEDEVKLNDANGKSPSIQTKNGVIIEVDKVLLPKGF